MKYLLCKKWDTQHSKGIVTLDRSGISTRIPLVCFTYNHTKRIEPFPYDDFYKGYKKQLIQLNRIPI